MKVIMKQDLILILDLGGEENVLLARAIRKLGVYSEIHPHDISRAVVEAMPNLRGIILSGGKHNTVDGGPIDVAPWLPEIGVPLLYLNHPIPLPGTAERRVATAPAGKVVASPRAAAYPGTAASRQTTAALEAVASRPLIRQAPVLPSGEKPLEAMLRPFLFEDCRASANWTIRGFIESQISAVRRQIGERQVLLALSGGVDSTVVAALLLTAVGRQLYCIHVDHGLMRKGESRQVEAVFRRQMGPNLICVDASARFLGKLSGVADPEEKRKIIGAEFISVFEEESAKLGKMDFLAQGTIYPDIVESGTKTARAVKSHHNVGGLPENMQFQLVEPLKFLFKDEVRACGLALGLPEDMVYRQPFPGPGLGVRCLGVITPERLGAVRESDAILREEFAAAGLDRQIWQFFTVVPEFKSVGVKDGTRTYQYPVIIRAINTVDAMTAEVPPLDWALLQKLAGRILAEVPGVNRVLYDLSPKPTATIEWE